MTDKVEIAKLKMWKAEQIASDLNNWLESDNHTVKEMMDCLRSVSIEGSASQQWRFVLTGIRKYGVRDAINKFPNQFGEIGIDRRILPFINEENDKEPWLIEPLRNELEDTIEQCYIKKMGSLDDVTVLGSTLIRNRVGSDNKWARYSRDQWVDWSRSKGSNAQIKGPVKFGKTDLALTVGEYAREDGADITTNIAHPKRPDWEYTVKLSQLIMSICKSKLNKKRTMFLLDEAGLFWARIDTVQSVPKDLAKLVLCLGKLECNLVFVSHFEELVPTIIRRTSVATFEKRSIKSAFVEIKQGDFKMEPQVVTHIPPSTIPFDQDQLAFFNRDMHVSDLLEYISQIEASENQWEALIDYVKAHAGEADETSDISPKQVAKWLRSHPKLSIRKIAAIVQVSVSTVHSWVSEGEIELDRASTQTSVEVG